MNIRQAKQYIRDTVRLYLKKDEFGEYRIPVLRQRPIFLLGAPGIGKTAVMEQVAQELGIALVSYSMTHHTRQSALGLPRICEKRYGDRTYPVSEYTMSEIIASLYECMEESGIREGILFLDEINCVSETLAPSMLQFLQYKVFGRHKVPDGWVIVTAGNPPEYNRSVREFDVVTMDRLKIIEVDADFEAWKAYAQERGIHSAVLSFLELKKDAFYQVETTARGRSYVTARGWEDLSQMLQLYEEEQMPVDETLVGQYLRSDRIVREFTAYYDLYQKYRRDYQIEALLGGEAPPEAIRRAKAAGFDERLSLLGMLLGQVTDEMRGCVEQADYLSDLLGMLRAQKALAERGGQESADELLHLLERQIEGRRALADSLQKASALSDANRRKHRRVRAFLEEGEKALRLAGPENAAAAFALLRGRYEERTAAMKRDAARIGERLHRLFVFTQEAFAEGEEGGGELLVLMTELTAGAGSSRFLALFGSEDYRKYNEELMLSERGGDLQRELRELDL